MSILSMLFGKSRKRRSASKKKSGKAKKPDAKLRRLCKRLKVKIMAKRGGKRVYKSVKVLKKQCRSALKRKAKGGTRKGHVRRTARRAYTKRRGGFGYSPSLVQMMGYEFCDPKKYSGGVLSPQSTGLFPSPCALRAAPAGPVGPAVPVGPAGPVGPSGFGYRRSAFGPWAAAFGKGTRKGQVRRTARRAYKTGPYSAAATRVRGAHDVCTKNKKKACHGVCHWRVGVGCARKSFAGKRKGQAATRIGAVGRGFLQRLRAKKAAGNWKSSAKSTVGRANLKKAQHDKIMAMYKGEQKKTLSLADKVKAQIEKEKKEADHAKKDAKEAVKEAEKVVSAAASFQRKNEKAFTALGGESARGYHPRAGTASKQAAVMANLIGRAKAPTALGAPNPAFFKQAGARVAAGEVAYGRYKRAKARFGKALTAFGKGRKRRSTRKGGRRKTARRAYRKSRFGFFFLNKKKPPVVGNGVIIPSEMARVENLMNKVLLERISKQKPSGIPLPIKFPLVNGHKLELCYKAPELKTK